MGYEKSGKDIISKFIDKGILLSTELKGKWEYLANQAIQFHKDIAYLDQNSLTSLLLNGKSDLNWIEFEKAKAHLERYKEDKAYNGFVSYLGTKAPEEKKEGEGEVKLVSFFEEISSKREVKDFTMYFNSRLSALQKILSVRDELKGLTSISRVLGKKEREQVSIIGLVKEKAMTKNGNLMLTLEDNTGEIKVLINKNKPEVFDEAKDIVLDEAIGVVGVNGDKIIFANKVLWPEIPMTKEFKKSGKEGYALFLSDIHVGSANFLEGDFERFLLWINQETGNDKQKEVASKVKYIFIAGDLIDGVGIYPGQEEDLVITDVEKQYERCVELLLRIPHHIKLIICGGNHDAMRIAEPQPPFNNEFCKILNGLPNVIIVSNPAVVNIHSDEEFSGYDVLIYHGYSFDYYVANVDSIRNNGGYDRADLIMKFLLKRRHLAPTHTSTLYVPYADKDPLVIDVVPDFFVTGHIHKSVVASYKNITLISGSCWQSKTAFQEKVGHHPEPSRVPAVDLATREIKILRFGK